MKKTTLLISSTLLFISLSAQIWEDNLLKLNDNPTVNEKFEAFESFREINDYSRGNGYNPYAREMYFIKERILNDNIFNPNSLYIEWKKEKEKYKYTKQETSSNWISKGPINTPIILSNGKKRGNGRVNCIAFDPVDANIIWVGSPAGGLWKSVDGGSNWITNTDDLPVIGVSHIAIDPNNNQIMYIVTGDADATDTYSIGILKSIDSGLTWNTTGLSYAVDQQKTVNKVIINPNFTDSLYAVTNQNILISADAGSTWQTTGALGRWRDIEFKPNNPSVAYAAKQSGGSSTIYRTTDGGANWNLITNGLAGSRYRPLLAVTPANPEVIYALFSESDYSFHGLYKSTDSGDNWLLQSDSPNIFGWDTDGTGTGGQSWYDMSLGVSTNDESLVYVGGINIWRSDDNGVNWDIDASSGNGSNYSYMHVDQHAFEFNPHTHVAYAGNDGGFYKFMESLNKWVDISDGLEISQFYNLGLSRSNPDRLVAGAQDNGTEMLTNTTWDAIRGADGMECAIDHYDENIIYSESQYGGLRKSYNGGNNWNNIKPVNYEGAWNTPYEMHSINSNLIVAGYDEVYRSTDGGGSWDSISYNVSGGADLRSIALAPSDENYIYAASYSKIKMTKDAGLTWYYIKPGLPNYNITDIAVSTNNADRAWVTFSDYNSTNKVYETNDAGVTWTNITGNNLPGLPVNCITYQGNAKDDLYIGTDIGVYHKDNTMSEWVPYNNGLPNVIVKELEIHYDEGTISAATYGRGVWESALNTLSGVNTFNVNKLDFTVYPNPADNQIIISTNAKNIELTIFNITGQKIITTTSKSVDISMLSKGYYIVSVIAEGRNKRKKLIIK